MNDMSKTDFFKSLGMSETQAIPKPEVADSVALQEAFNNVKSNVKSLVSVLDKDANQAQLFHAIFTVAPAAGIVYEGNNVARINLSFEKMMGYTLEEVQRGDFLGLPQEESEKQIIDNELCHEYLCTVKNKEGKELPIHVREVKMGLNGHSVSIAVFWLSSNDKKRGTY